MGIETIIGAFDGVEVIEFVSNPWGDLNIIKGGWEIFYRYRLSIWNIFFTEFTRRLICYRWRKSKLVILYMFIEDINMYMTAHWWSKFVIKDRWKREHFFTLINHNFVRHENERHVKISSVKVCLLTSYWLTSFMYSRFTMPLKSQESIQNRTVKNKAAVSR